MARNKRQTFGKLQRERERAEKRERKQEKKEAKKAAAAAGLVFDPETGEFVEPDELADQLAGELETPATPPGELRD